MSFALQISNAQVAGVRAAGVPAHVEAPPAPVVTLRASGVMQRADVDAVFAECRRLFARGADTIVIDVDELTIADGETREFFVRELAAERALQHHVFVCAGSAAAHATFAACDDASAWLMPEGGTDADLARRNFTTHTPLHPETAG